MDGYTLPPDTTRYPIERIARRDHLAPVRNQQEAIAAYVAHFQAQPNLVLVNAVDHLELTDIVVRSERTIQPNTFWIGHEDRMGVTATPSE